MSEVTLHNDKVGGTLAEAMMLLEMTTTFADLSASIPTDDLIEASHELIAQARSSYVGGTPKPLSERAQATMAAVAALDECGAATA